MAAAKKKPAKKKVRVDKRHRSVYKPAHKAPYELGRGRVDNFVKCPACFWLTQVKGANQPSFGGYNINLLTDQLLKREFDFYREKKKPHPFMTKHGLGHLVPFKHPDLEKWEESTQFGYTSRHLNTLHEETDILLGGGLDDVWQSTKAGMLYIVDYKSTANLKQNPEPVSLLPPKNPKEPDYKASYRRQMDMYQFILRRKPEGFKVSNTGYFLYVDGQHTDIGGMLDKGMDTGTLKFKATLLPYKGDDSWVEPALFSIKKLLSRKTCPQHSAQCKDDNKGWHAYIGNLRKGMDWKKA